MANTSVPTGGPSTINGVLYQMLWSLFRTAKLHISECGVDNQTGAITNVVVRLEPIGGGGDFQELGMPTKLVDQVKSRPDGSTWSLKEVIEGILPDLYRAVDLGETSVTYRLVTEGRMGRWEKAYEFFRSLENRTYAPLALDNSSSVFVSNNAGSDPNWQGQSYTEQTLFGVVFEAMRSLQDVQKSESPDDTRRKLWHLLGHFEFVGERTQAALQKELDDILLALVTRDCDLATKRDEMLLDLMRRATSGDAMIGLSDFMAAHKLDSVPWTDWLRLCQRSEKLLVGSLGRRRYDPAKDVRRVAAREAATQWQENVPLLVVSGESGQGKSWFLYSAARVWASRPQLVVLTEATGDFDRDIEHVTQTCRSIRDTDEVLPLERIAARLRRLGCCPKGPWLTLVIDGVQDMEEARQISLASWAEWGVRVAVSCQKEVAEWIEKNAPGRCLGLTVSDFSAGELSAFLSQMIGNKWTMLPGDVRETLRRRPHTWSGRISVSNYQNAAKTWRRKSDGSDGRLDDLWGGTACGREYSFRMQANWPGSVQLGRTVVIVTGWV